MVTCQTHAQVQCMLHLVHALSLAVMVEWSGPRYKCGGQVLCSALGIGPVGSVFCVGCEL